MERQLNMLFIWVQYTAFLIRPIWPTYTNQWPHFLITKFYRVDALHAHRLHLQAQISNAFPVLLKAVPLQAWSGPEGTRKLRFPDFMTTAQDGGKVVSLTHRPFYPQEIHVVLISVRGWVEPRAIVRPEGLCHWKIPMTPSGIEPATCRFVA
jgi:hypothetical protein